ncbi:MAG: DegV family protein, partial [Peptococcaceae bacterium]
MIRIITDSSSELDPELAARLQVDVIPIHIYFGETEYLDRQTLSVSDFYHKLEQVETLPTTSQITPFQFYQAFQPYVEAGDEIVGIFLSSQLSGTFQSAQAALQMLNTEHVYLVDSLNAALGHHLLVQIAVRLRDQGLSARQIAQQLETLRHKVRLFACVKTMKYLVMGGRVPAAVGKIGGILGITPLIAVVDGKVEAVGKVRGHKAAHRWMQQQLEKEPADAQYPVVFCHSVNPQGRDEMVEALDSFLPNHDYLHCDLGSTVGTHIGPGAIGFAYIA